MATTSAILEMILLALGESASGGYLNWGEVTNENITKLEKTVGEVESVAVTTANVSLTDAQHNALFIKATGALTGNRAIETQDRKGFWFVTNNCTGDFTLSFETTSGTGIVVPQGATAILASDGTNVLRIATLPSGGKAPGASTLQSKAAGFTAGVADNGNFFECTAALTMALKPAALLGADWACIVKATTGATVIDPDSAELINGAATLTLAEGTAALVFCTGTAFRAVVTINGATLTTPTLTLKQSATPTPTAEGDIQWDTDDHVIAVGDSAGTQLFVPIPASTAAGDLLYLSGAKVYTRLPKGTAAQVLAMNSGATAPEWVTASSFANTFTSLGTVNTTSGTTQSITGLATTYKALFLVISGVSSGSSATLRVAFSSDNGGAYGTVRTLSSSAVASDTITGSAWLYNTGNNGATKVVAPSTVTTASTPGVYFTVATEGVVTGLIDALRFSPSAGSFDAGSITVYGVS